MFLIYELNYLNCTQLNSLISSKSDICRQLHSSRYGNNIRLMLFIAHYFAHAYTGRSHPREFSQTAKWVNQHQPNLITTKCEASTQTNSAAGRLSISLLSISNNLLNLTPNSFQLDLLQNKADITIVRETAAAALRQGWMGLPIS